MARTLALALTAGAMVAAGACRSSRDGLVQIPTPVEAALDGASGAGGDLPGAEAELAGTAGVDVAPASDRLDAAEVEDGAEAVDPPGSLATELPRGPLGPPPEVGCSDGTREGFLASSRWPAIAACAGGFRVAGLGPDPGLVMHCDREAGNTGANPSGVGCSVADLCAQGWHVCADAGEVGARADAGCEGAVPAGYALFFVVRAGASADGVCAPGLDFRNDLQGCGSFGEATHPTCAPLDRRLSFADCAATGGLWSCGDSTAHLQETDNAQKPGPALGGALCCRDLE